MHGNSTGTLTLAGFTAMFVFFHFGALTLRSQHDAERRGPAAS